MPRMVTAKPNMEVRPELELLLCSARPTSAGNEERIRELIAAGVNWQEVLACASQHNLLPILCRNLDRIEGDRLASNEREALIEIARHLGTNSMLFLGEMLRLYDVFEKERIPAIPFKGPVLAWLAYRDFTLRTYTDLDFVVPQRYIPQAVSLLKAAGYNTQFDAREAQAGEHGQAPGQYAFVSAVNGALVELHTERTLRYFPRRIDLQEMNSRLIAVEIGGRKVLTFSVEDTLVMLCVHGAKHFWERLAWILDIAQLIASEEVDWELLFAIAAKMESTRVVLLGLYLAHDLFRAPLPKSVLQDACNEKQVQWLVNRARDQYMGISNPSSGVWQRALFRLRSRDEFWQGLLHLFRLGTSPTESDRQTVSLPRLLAPLYIVVRPWRLLRSYGWGLKRR